ncbi:molybdate transport system substrate-binding protein [Agromyces sp. CF514]|uniref:molybdate ABC transporter substrate-binding protein n=1 Tax=Agromyces sp. CF514 TaxID=1881031 RepID=UPI0008F32C52|nr:molybdate ABC transporter substrate-binding protein [Agromyces sp. CF514]SFR82497.1 molybdate transport system substrate-binding protein [Agromyces sp. CF514]
MTRTPTTLRTTTGLAAAALVALALAGCATGGSGDEDPNAPAATGSAAPDLAAAEVTVLAAASLTEAFDDLATQFEAANPSVEITVSYGGSGALATQITEGAPADVFASAAEPPMQQVVDAGLAEDPVIFATNTLELVVPAGNPAGVTGLEDLANPDLRIALCDESVPCGAASAKLLANEGITAAPDTLESDVKAVLTKVSLGEVDAALVYRTDVQAAGDDVEGIEVEGADEVVNRYPIAAIADASADAQADADAARSAAATAFVAFVTGEAGRETLDAYGFGTP